MSNAPATVTLTAHMFNRTQTTTHASIEEARARVLAIAVAQQCTIEPADELAGSFIPQTTTHGSEGSYQIDVEDAPTCPHCLDRYSNCGPGHRTGKPAALRPIWTPEDYAQTVRDAAAHRANPSNVVDL